MEPDQKKIPRPRLPLMVECMNGRFEIPVELFERLMGGANHGMIYIREDEDLVQMSLAPLKGGRRRQLRRRWGVTAFRDASRVAIIDLVDHIAVMAVEWKRRRPDSTITTSASM